MHTGLLDPCPIHISYMIFDEHKNYQVALSDISDTVTHFCQKSFLFFLATTRNLRKKYNNAKLSSERKVKELGNQDKIVRTNEEKNQ